MADQKPLEEAPRALIGKSASEVEIIRWVARHISHPKPSAKECPDPFAWTLLLQCRGNQAMTAWFIEKLWVKLIPSRSQLETTAEKVLDGTPTLQLIERVREISARVQAKLEKEEEAAKPPPVPDAFANYNPENDE